MQRFGDLPRLDALQDELGDVALARGEVEGGHDQRHDLRRRASSIVTTTSPGPSPPDSGEACRSSHCPLATRTREDLQPRTIATAHGPTIETSHVARAFELTRELPYNVAPPQPGQPVLDEIVASMMPA